MESLLGQLHAAGAWAGLASLLYLALIAFLGCVAALSNRPVRRTSALKVLRLLWVRRETGRRSPDSHEPRRRGSS